MGFFPRGLYRHLGRVLACLRHLRTGTHGKSFLVLGLLQGNKAVSASQLLALIIWLYNRFGSEIKRVLIRSSLIANKLGVRLAGSLGPALRINGEAC